MSDFTKTGSQIDEWAVVTAATMREGAATAIADDMAVMLEITVAKNEAVAHDGHCEVIVETSGNTSGDEDWTELCLFEIDAETATKTDVDQNSSSTTLYVTSTTNMETTGDLLFVHDTNAIADSEIVRVNGYSNDDYITLLDALTNAKDTDDDVYTGVNQWIVSVPAEARRVRVLVNNKDADCNVVSRTRIAKVTDIE